LRKRLSLLAFALIPLLLFGCGARTSKVDGREVAVGERFKLSREEKVFVKDAALTLQLKSVRRTWYVDGKSETAEAEIIIALDGKEQRRWMGMGEKVEAGDYVVELEAADPFGKTSCELVVMRRR
jgi:hypothetical protein